MIKKVEGMPEISSIPLHKTLVVGIGNPLLQDDGVGVHVVERLQAGLPDLPEVKFLDGGTLGFHMIGEIEDARNLLVIDAAQLNEQSGSVRIFQDEDMDRFLGEQKNSSAHDVTLVDLISIASLADRLPTRRALIGIQPDCIDWGMEPTPPVQAAIPIACEMAMELIQQWRT